MNDRIEPGRPLKQGTPRPVGPRVGAARFSDLGGPMNPSGVMSAQFLMLLQALKTGDKPENIATALQHYMDSRTPHDRAKVDVARLLASSASPDEALRKLLTALKVGIKTENPDGGPAPLDSIPASVKAALEQAVSHIVGTHARGLESDARRALDDVASLRQRFGLASADEVVESLLR